MGILAGPVGWIITGVWTAIDIAGPAYRVTVPACVLVAALRLKLKAEQEAKQKAEQEAKQKAEQEARLKAEQERLEQAERLAKQKAEREANKTKKMWYLVIAFCILIGLAVLAVFYMKGKHQSSNNPKSGVENLKNPSHKN
ncbi:flagellar biosynthesis protein FlgG [Helicobacter pylori]|nr:flagellar biosynthesis protein FlgG [Helicobacter pylori]